METLKSTIKQEKHNHEKTPYIGILQSCPKSNNNASTNIQNHNIESPIQQMFSYTANKGPYI